MECLFTKYRTVSEVKSVKQEGVATGCKTNSTPHRLTLLIVLVRNRQEVGSQRPSFKEQ